LPGSALRKKIGIPLVRFCWKALASPPRIASYICRGGPLSGPPRSHRGMSNGCSFWWWVAFFALIIFLLVGDLCCFTAIQGHQAQGVASVERLLVSWSAVRPVCAVRRAGPGRNYWSGLPVEQSLSVDNLFVFLVIFRLFRRPRKYQSRSVLGYPGRPSSCRGSHLHGCDARQQIQWILYLFGIS